jgi:hypothetical protein
MQLQTTEFTHSLEPDYVRYISLLFTFEFKFGNTEAEKNTFSFSLETFYALYEMTIRFFQIFTDRLIYKAPGCYSLRHVVTKNFQLFRRIYILLTFKIQNEITDERRIFLPFHSLPSHTNVKRRGFTSHPTSQKEIKRKSSSEKLPFPRPEFSHLY